MTYWDPWQPVAKEPRRPCELADLFPGESAWPSLSPAARRMLVKDLRIPVRSTSDAIVQAATSLDETPLRELIAAGLVEEVMRGKVRHVSVPKRHWGFVNRMRALFGLVTASQHVGWIHHYLRTMFDPAAATSVVSTILKAAKPPIDLGYTDAIAQIVPRRSWPERVTGFLKNPLADAIIQAIETAAGRLHLHELAARLPDHKPAVVREVLEQLLLRLALVEGLEPKSLNLYVGFSPGVYEDRVRNRMPATFPESVPAPLERSPEAGWLIPDLRAVLYELSGTPARLKVNGGVFQKDLDRLAGVVTALPNLIKLEGPIEEFDEQETANATNVCRVLESIRWAEQLTLVTITSNRSGQFLELSSEGRKWLALPAQAQESALFDCMRDARPRSDLGWFGFTDSLFLGSDVISVVVPPRKTKDNYRPTKPEERLPLRQTLHRLFEQLPLGKFVPLQPFLRYAVRMTNNPLLLGLTPDKVVVIEQYDRPPLIEEILEDRGFNLLVDLINTRLVPLGCLVVGGEDDNLVIARQPRLDAYFDPSIKREDVPAHADVTRVVVQPDFTIIVIGLNPAPVMDLAPFCDRESGKVAAGSLIFRLSRESIFRASAAGLKPQEVTQRLRKHAGNEIPVNVLTQVQSWCDQVRQVSSQPATLIRCPDAATADRVRSVLGKKAERVGEDMVAFFGARLTSTERQKLQANGILLDEDQRETKAKKKRRGWD